MSMCAHKKAQEYKLVVVYQSQTRNNSTSGEWTKIVLHSHTMGTNKKEHTTDTHNYNE